MSIGVTLKSHVRDELRKELQLIGKRCGFTEFKHWYHVKWKDISNHGGSRLLKVFGGSPIRAVTTLFEKDFAWNLSHFKRKTASYWLSRESQRSFLDELGKRLKISRWEDWYSVSQDTIGKHGGWTLLKHYNFSPSAAISSVYSEHDWKVYKFENVPKRTWKDLQTHRELIEDIGKKLNIQRWDDWYSVTSKDIEEFGGTKILKFYGYSPSRLLSTVLYEFPWKMHRFDNIPRGHWNSRDKERQFFNELAAAQQVNWKSPADWRRVSLALVAKHGGKGIIQKYGNLSEALRTIYPELPSAPLRISRPQEQLYTIVKKFIPDIQVNYKHPKLMHSAKPGLRMELDLFSPSLNLAIEYQGEHHFLQLWERCQDPKTRKFRDKEKLAACSRANIILVTFPYWLQITEREVLSALRKSCTSLEQSDGNTANDQFSSPQLSKPDFMLGSSFDPCSVSGLPSLFPVIVEKLDGIRALWDGSRFFTRQGQILYAPESFTRHLPKSTVEGELWSGVSTFHQLQSILGGNNWDNVSFQLFDAPQFHCRE
eukprot:TRINITY_DN5299_c0_g1_i1.p1 TRINITY_DN5299_c0_g1~~TRINITY_DN5299_c0_g1_i1.p1  ORF type:complete len:540 (-),score=100.78 TRINITY_DN5299_c0_g1_i1:292-1911(-)